ncbi:hypothetical protein [Mucilaginibacter kameinonensis]|uniref:hypothetical protein n=1 Tax=Mucilaginibacter kameinonensis TaxID=452286 RepID=UPI000EF78C8F|nr:hypothetical protein [Mucilaginibacter kameinonensis]
MKLLQDILLPIYTLSRTKRGADSQGASNLAKSIAAAMLFLSFNLIRDLFVLCFISKRTYNANGIIFNNDHYVLIGVALCLGIFCTSTKSWEDEHQRTESDGYALAVPLIILAMLILGAASINLKVHDVFK